MHARIIAAIPNRADVEECDPLPAVKAYFADHGGLRAVLGGTGRDGFEKSIPERRGDADAGVRGDETFGNGVGGGDGDELEETRGGEEVVECEGVDCGYDGGEEEKGEQGGADGEHNFFLVSLFYK
jgi:hypothetical protein